LLDLLGKVSEVTAGVETKESRDAYRKLLAEQSRQQNMHSHSHSHSHGGEPCGHNHGGNPDPMMPETPYHLRFHRLTSFHYKALQPLLANTKVNFRAEVIKPYTDGTTSPDEPKGMIVACWIEDAKNSSLRYMEATASFVKN
jgi:hypothetical protein